ncbi:NADP-dependent isocitrate dehydrogenase [Ignavibacteria bacterium CHB1]|jgi:isocitrate dehydrogenase|nr:MAG: 3-isopropylmalate dehydrogenase [Chlorobi bacterium OLB4]MBV6398996.1 Isocitrate dehydrogenase [NADP] [Ignavibacteria bacterium]MBW7856689.1 NADP-dependent isocitrate dehydrogenase [Ignavibacteria bacterium]MDL1887944.1 NADP-dependent isocitrate dehydrogenase [Ignavibacteria bacterium CHB1]OQY77167.1 MAG: isocitrate dehydrogenase [Ignavibacteriales bacterium UTCHB1]
MATKTPITVAYGDGIGPEIMEATLNVLEAANAQLDIEVIEIGEKVYLSGNSAGIAHESWESLLKTKVFLKAPITTPQGGGYKSLNVTTRKTLGLYANIRPCLSYHPFIKTKHPVMDLVIVRENEEDLYAGIEHRQTKDVYQCLKLISRPGSEKIIRYAFEYAVTNNRRKVTCLIKDNIMKLTDGIFHKVFHEIGEDYPDIEKVSMIVDIGAARLATTPEDFDVIVMENLYGDILSDVAAQMTGSVGLAGSANIGEQCAMFEAIHGSAPQIAGKYIANPSGLIKASVLMLNHIGQFEVATKIENALLKLIEDGIHTPDIFNEEVSRLKVGTRQFTEELIDRLGEKPGSLRAVNYTHVPKKLAKVNYIQRETIDEKKELAGVDIFLDWNSGTANDLGNELKKLNTAKLSLLMISNRGVKVYPDGLPQTFCTDHWRCRFKKVNDVSISNSDIIELLSNVNNAGLEFIKTEHLYDFNGEPGYSLAQGE